MSRITEIGSKIKIEDTAGGNTTNTAKPTEEIFSPETKNPTKGTKVEKENTSPEIGKAYRFLHILSNDDILNDNTLLAELEELKNSKLNPKTILDNFRINSGNVGGLLDHLEELAHYKIIKQSTFEKYKRYFTDELEKYFCFNKNFRSKNQTYEFEYKNYKYKSDRYNVIQKDENILEIENLTTKEKRTIDFRELLPKKMNGIQDIISLKSTIQRLPAEILFQIPEEVNIIVSKEALKDTTATMDKKTGEIKSAADEIEGQFVIHGNGMETLTTDSFSDTIIHEIAHAIFIDNNGNDTLEKNEKLVEIYNKAAEKYKKENNYLAERDGYTEEGYWTNEIGDLGAEIINAVFTNNTFILDTLDKYAPETIEIVLNEFKKRFTAEDKHYRTDINTLLNYYAKEEEKNTPNTNL